MHEELINFLINKLNISYEFLNITNGDDRSIDDTSIELEVRFKNITKEKYTKLYNYLSRKRIMMERQIFDEKNYINDEKYRSRKYITYESSLEDVKHNVGNLRLNNNSSINISLEKSIGKDLFMHVMNDEKIITDYDSYFSNNDINYDHFKDSYLGFLKFYKIFYIFYIGLKKNESYQDYLIKYNFKNFLDKEIVRLFHFCKKIGIDVYFYEKIKDLNNDDDYENYRNYIYELYEKIEENLKTMQNEYYEKYVKIANKNINKIYDNKSRMVNNYRKKRHIFKPFDKNHEIHLTEISNLKFMENDEYQIEIEFNNFLSENIIDLTFYIEKTIRNYYNIIYSDEIYTINNIISNEEKTKIMENVSQKLIKSLNKPIDLNWNNFIISDFMISEFSNTDYISSLKIDGVNVLLLFFDKKVYEYSIYNKKLKTLDIKTNIKNLHIFQAESLNNEYYIFDFLSKYDVLMKKYHDRIKDIEIFLNDKLIIKNNDYFKFLSKKHYHISDKFTESIIKAYEEMEKSKIPNDGVIINNYYGNIIEKEINYQYYFFAGNTLKFKPLHLLTIDFLYRNNTLFCKKDNELKELGELIFFVFKYEIINNKNIKLENDKIYEFSLDLNLKELNIKFYVQRIREDKLNPNYYEIVKNIISLHIKPITIETIKFKNDDLLYFIMLQFAVNELNYKEGNLNKSHMYYTDEIYLTYYYVNYLSEKYNKNYPVSIVNDGENNMDFSKKFFNNIEVFNDFKSNEIDNHIKHYRQQILIYKKDYSKVEEILNKIFSKNIKQFHIVIINNDEDKIKEIVKNIKGEKELNLTFKYPKQYKDQFTIYGKINIPYFELFSTINYNICYIEEKILRQ